MATITPAILPPGHHGPDEQALEASLAAARRARGPAVRGRGHRAMAPLRVTTPLLLQALLLPIAVCALLVWGQPVLFEMWRSCIQFWAQALGLPPALGIQPGPGVVQAFGIGDRPLPTQGMLAATAAATLLLLVASFQLKGARLPLKYPLRILCAVLVATLVYFWLMPGAFPYGIARHGEELMSIGYAVMLATPVMLAAGYYILNERLAVKLGATAAILVFLAVLVPFQVLAHAFVLHHLSVLFMPALYICFGAVFDALVFVALYSWLVSGASPDATR